MKNNTVNLPKKVAEFIEKSAIKCEIVEHRTVYTAFDKAATLKTDAKSIAKVLTLKMDKNLALAVVGGDRNLDLQKVQKLAKAKKNDFAKEKVIGETFKGIDPGAIPPFEALWNLPVFCDKKILESPRLVLSGGLYECSIKISPGAFKKANPTMIMGSFSIARPKSKKQPKKAKKAAAKAVKIRKKKLPRKK